MILEIAHFHIAAGLNGGFEMAFKTAEKILAGMQGYVSHVLYRCIEDAGEYRLLVQWQTVEDHTEGFRQSPQFTEWRALLQPFFSEPPVAAHFEQVSPAPNEHAP
ncbi:antibiotic biosynthesis monooxygenase family protein [Burkholderia gladioli]|uniref:antibiotic biosynthesis monooxygenase family protein n=1 Tax=Burkholderia gladioli TaxID=28095 RepID=UPI003B986F27